MRYFKSGIKINLSLKVVGKRPDNFHLLDSIFLPIEDIYDEISFEIKAAEELKINFSSNLSNIAGFDGNDNLVVRAAQLYCKKANIKADIAIHLKKNIPIGGGVGGGSGNAGCILKVLNEYFKACQKEDLAEMALSLGADVPFFIYNQAARINGIGEVITPFEVKNDLYFILIFPNFPVSTPWAFKNLSEAIKQEDKLKRNDLIINGLKSGDFDLIYNNLHNDFETILFDKYLLYSVIQKTLGDRKLSISGSGSTCFVLCRNQEEQEAVFDSLMEKFANDNITIKKVAYKK